MSPKSCAPVPLCVLELLVWLSLVVLLLTEDLVLLLVVSVRVLSVVEVASAEDPPAPGGMGLT